MQQTYVHLFVDVTSQTEIKRKKTVLPLMIINLLPIVHCVEYLIELIIDLIFLSITPQIITIDSRRYFAIRVTEFNNFSYVWLLQRIQSVFLSRCLAAVPHY